MSLDNNLLAAYRVVGGEYVDQSPVGGANGVKTGTPTTSVGDGGETFFNFDGSTTSIEMPLTPINAYTTSATMAIRCFGTVDLGTNSAVASLGLVGQTTSNLALRGSGSVGDVSGFMRDLGSNNTATNLNNTSTWDGTERVLIVEYNSPDLTLSIFDEVEGIFNTQPALAQDSSFSFDRITAGARFDTTWPAQVSISWVAVWPRVLTPTEKEALADSPWPDFIGGGQTDLDNPGTFNEIVHSAVGVSIKSATGNSIN
jgi:hypothetical protein